MKLWRWFKSIRNSGSPPPPKVIPEQDFQTVLENLAKDASERKRIEQIRSAVDAVPALRAWCVQQANEGRHAPFTGYIFHTNHQSDPPIGPFIHHPEVLADYLNMRLSHRAGSLGGTHYTLKFIGEP